MYVDVTSPATPEELASDEYISKLSRWCVTTVRAADTDCPPAPLVGRRP